MSGECFTNLRHLAWTLGLLGAFGTGCIVEVAHGPYEACNAGEACSNGTSCVTATFSTNSLPGNICSSSCTSGAQCPSSVYGAGYLPTCVVSATSGTGLCYDTCVSNADCGIGTRCARISGTANNICVPIGTGTAACGASGQACCAGNACLAGLSCNAGTCGAAATPNRTAYQKCDAATDVCASGTTCVASIAQVSGKSRGTSCTATCPSGNAMSCPGYVPGAATQTVECVNFTGNIAQAQCFRLCTSQNDCVNDNTTCTAFMMPTGQIRVCVPAGPRL